MAVELLPFLLDPQILAYALIAMNLLAFVAFGIDKARAERGAWRVSEATLMQLAIFGGIGGRCSATRRGKSLSARTCV